MNLSKIHHIAIIVSDYEAAKDFYVNKLGFAVIRENYRPERKDWKLDLRVNEHTELEIFAEENPPKRVNRPEACGLRHLAFCVDSVEQTVNELVEVGIECEPIRVDDYTGKKMTFFHDPDVQKSTVICAITEDVNLSWEGWQHYRKIEENAGGVFEKNETRVLSASGESA